MQVVRAARTALGGVVLPGRGRRVVGGEAECDQVGILGRDAEAERDALCRLDRVALRLSLVDDAAEMPGLVREGFSFVTYGLSKTAMLSTWAVCGNMFTAPTAVHWYPAWWTSKPASRASVAGLQLT